MTIALEGGEFGIKFCTECLAVSSVPGKIRRTETLRNDGDGWNDFLVRTCDRRYRQHSLRLYANKNETGSPLAALIVAQSWFAAPLA
jgi:hypothetical protein